MADDREERIRKRAYELWERDGSPEGQNDAHWHEAAREIDAQMQDESRTAGDTGPEPEVHKSDEDSSGPGTPKPPSRAKTTRKKAASGTDEKAEGEAKPARKTATKAAAKSTKAPARATKPRKPRAKKGDAPDGAS
ncbi:DUF2934 domain-containing protein [Limimaricola litoreus]|uniref:DUF2934 domain-containing protein n=1 Tax=Limimaricola litoreus TaxID=2955316 RepID=A0A9X2FQ57_9RHOB|nr:DUF2934 domain-containing protein [Limimaricola litoreus]MCP1169594.1 DUF2934 domain-containing protein [Limimaricola litoreus]